MTKRVGITYYDYKFRIYKYKRDLVVIFQHTSKSRILDNDLKLNTINSQLYTNSYVLRVIYEAILYVSKVEG